MRFSCPYNARCIRTKRILEAKRGEGAERHVDVRQFDAHAIRQICRTASDSLRSNVYTSFSLSLSLLLLVAPSLLLSRARKRAERKVEAGNLSVDNESGEWERIGTMSKKKKKKGKRKRWRFSEPISRLRFKQNVGRFFLEMEETLNKTFDLYVSRFLSLFSRDCSEKSPRKNNWPSS